ncbi:hypothetical protein [Micromonospora endophytica]|uniref:hypothetical protein n=1 Tax=Micromonospora endophytica TaxID=515350 RepID=UPI0011B751B1|nr:hypothetical protein [Micromonospora endophytica]
MTAPPGKGTPGGSSGEAPLPGLGRWPGPVRSRCSAGQTLAAIAEAGLGVAVFGDTADLRGFALRRHQLLDASGRPLSFDLYAAWIRDGVPSDIRNFAVELATSFRPPTGRTAPVPSPSTVPASAT